MKRGTNTYHERVALGGEDLDLLNGMRLAVDTIHLNNPQVMVVNGEQVVRIASHVDETHAVAANVIKISRAVWAREKWAHRLPRCTLITARGEAGPLEKRPNPLINVASAVGGIPAGSFLAKTWYQSARVRTVESERSL